ncbi:MAG: HEAT repeat domain-containing protein [Candidatus Wallbacteria bacterium]
MAVEENEQNLDGFEPEQKNDDSLSADQILKNLKNTDPKVRCEAITALSQVKNKRVVNLLINCLKDPIWTNRQAAANSLIEIGQIAIEPLIAVANSENEDIRFWCIRVLGALGGEGLDVLSKMIDEPDRDMRLHIIKSLGTTGQANAADALIHCIGDSDWAVRKHAAEGLEKIGAPAVAKLQKAFQDNLGSLGNDDICYWALKVLGFILKKDAIPTFVNLMKHPDNNIRFYAVGGLGETRCEEAIDPLISALSDQAWLVRRHSFEMIQIIGEMAIPKLKQAFVDGNDDIKYWAVRLIALILKGNSIEILKKLLSTPHKEIRYFVVSALGETDDPRAIPILVEMFKDDFWQIRQKAAEMIASIKFRAIPQVTKTLSNESEDVRYWAIQSLGMIGGEAMGPLLKLLAHPDKRMRLFAVKALGTLQNSEVIEPLIGALGDKSWPVRVSAADNLERIGEYAIRPLIKAIGSDNTDISFWSQKILQNFGDKAVQTLINSLQDKADKYRPHTIKALGRIGTKNSIKPLLEIISAGIIEECEVILESLSDIKNGQLIEYLLETVATTDDGNVVTWVSQILSTVKDAGKTVYFKALKHENISVRIQACKLLASYEGDDILKALWFAMQDKVLEVRIQAIKSVGEIGQGLNVIPYLLKLIKDQEILVRLEVYKLLAKIGAPASMMPLLEAYQQETPENQVRVMNSFKEIESTNFMISTLSILDSVDEQMRPLILKIVGHVCDSPLKRDMLIKNFETSTPQTVYWIIQVLSKFDDEQIPEALIKLLEREDVFECSVQALSKYLTTDGSRNFVVREKVNNALTKAGIKVIKPLLNCVDKTDEFMKMNAFQIIENMGEQIQEILKEVAADKSNQGYTLAVELLGSITRSARAGGVTQKWTPKLKDAGPKTDDQIEREMAKAKIK